MHEACPVAFWNWPLAQTWQTSFFSKRPASHFVQYVWPPSGCTEPAGHGAHAAWFFCVEIVCAAQSSHSAAIELMKEPGAHEPQYPALEPPQPWRAPAAHGSEEHSRQLLWPVTFWKEPSAQLWHAPPVANVPVAHGLQ